MTKEKAIIVHERLLKKFGEPIWRNPLHAIDELVSTILSQNTNDVNRDRGFDKLVETFPSWEEVRDAPTQEVIEAVRIAGLANQKGPRLQAALRQISDERGELNLEFLKEMSVEDARAWLTKFKGVGPKTAAIVLLFSLGMPAFPVDTHVYRITGRVGLRPQKISVEQAHPYLESVFPPKSYYAAHLNIIRLGREICKARKPNCTACPLLEICDYGQKSK